MCPGSSGQPPERGHRGRPLVAQVESVTEATAEPGTADTLIELCDLHSDCPSLRDLFPLRSEFASEPLLDPAL
jgi:hypothetical protein